jgi:hypothetical protein
LAENFEIQTFCSQERTVTPTRCSLVECASHYFFDVAAADAPHRMQVKVMMMMMTIIIMIKLWVCASSNTQVLIHQNTHQYVYFFFVGSRLKA